MTGTVDSSGRALLRLRMQHPISASETELDAWIDTAFTGELVLPLQQVVLLGFPLGPAVRAGLADGSEVEYGAIRVGNTRVLLDLVVHEFQRGASPEEIVDSYDALSLPDVYAVRSYYMSNPGPIDEYVTRREEEAAAVRRKIEAAKPPRPNLRPCC